MRRRSGVLVVVAALGLATGLAGCDGGALPTVDGVDGRGGPSSDRPDAVSLPPPGARFSYQIGGAYDPPDGVGVVSRDRAAAPADGTYSLCYVNAFQAQPDAVPWWEANHPDLLLRDAAGDLVIDRDWDEPLLDLRTGEQRVALAEVIGGWVTGCAEAGYAAVEADNLDSYLRSAGLLTQEDALVFAELLTAAAHDAGLAIGQKNAAELARQGRAAGFDFAVAEECEVYTECDAYTDVYGDQLLEIEYTDQDEAAFARACAARGDRVSVVRRDRDVLPSGEPGHVEQWCD